MGVFNGDIFTLNIGLCIVFITQLLIFIPSYILMMERKNRQPLKVRSSFSLHTLSFFSMLLIFSNIIEWVFFAEKLPCFWVVFTQFLSELIINSMNAYKIFFLMLLKRKQEDIKNVGQEDTSVFYNKLEFLKSKTFNRIVFSLVTLLMLLPAMLIPIWKREVIYITVKQTNIIYPEMLYCYSIMLLLALSYVFMALANIKKGDRLFLSKELLITGTTFLFLYILKFAFLFLPYNFVYPVTLLCPIIYGFVVFITAIMVPVVKTIVNEKQIIKKTNKDPVKRLHHILSLEQERENFRVHLLSEFSVENLEFYDAYTEFSKVADISSKEKNLETIFFIYNKFISKDSEFQVNISMPLRKEIESNIEEGCASPELFEKAANEIFYLMATDSLSRYKPKGNKI